MGAASGCFVTRRVSPTIPVMMGAFNMIARIADATTTA